MYDIELIVEHAGFASTGEVAAGVVAGDDGDSFALFVRERAPSRAFANRAARIQETVFRTCGLTIDKVVPVRSIPKTTSGKLRRAALAKSLMAGEFDQELAAIFAPIETTEKATA